MRLVRPSYEIKWHMPSKAAMELLEWAGRKCYKSEDKIGEGTAEEFLRRLLRRNPPHESIIEHVSASVCFTVDRGVSHELVRHRLAAYSQESTRYCNYKGGVTFVIPPWTGWVPRQDLDSHAVIQDFDAVNAPPDDQWLYAMAVAEQSYLRLLAGSWTPQQARDVLPNSLKTEVVATYNMRVWRHIFAMRVAEACHPQMREVMVPLLEDFKKELPALFENVVPYSDAAKARLAQLPLRVIIDHLLGREGAVEELAKCVFREHGG